MYKKVVIVSSAMLSIERPPAALAFLAGICEHNKVEYEIFDLNLFLLEKFGHERWKTIANIFSTLETITCDDLDLLREIDDVITLGIHDHVLSHTPDLVAISSFSHLQIPWTDKFLELLKKQSKVIVIAGGPGISYEQRPNTTAGSILLKKGLLDYYVLGEGDYVFDDFLKGKINLGVNSKKNLTENWVPQIDDLNLLVIFPTYKKIKLEKYKSAYENQSPVLTINGSRGCVRRCTFCDVGHIWKKFRFKSADNIIKEIVKNYHETKCLNYMFSDSLINGSLKQFTELMQGLIALQHKYADFKQFRYSGQFIIRPKKFHPEKLFELMRDSGCDNMQIGIESGSQRVREHMGKKFSNEDIDHHFEMCEKYKIKNHILMFVSYPTETIEDYQETVDFYVRNQKYLINDTIIGANFGSPMIILKNTPIDDMKGELGIEIHQDEYYNVSNWTVKSNPGLTLKERWRRYIHLIQLLTKLGYPSDSFSESILQYNLELLKKNLNKGKQINEFRN
jgi:anaerobic magnesium-protoporphyrin IX monomethyl ester cyclase